MFFYTTLIKYTVNDKKVNPLDVCFIRTLTMLVGTGILGLILREKFAIQKEDRCMMLLRCIAGTLGFTTFTFGVAMVPLLV